MHSTSHDRLDALDALRGFAALSVFVGHLLAEYDVDRGLFLSIISDGTTAVDLFFVLSGFVLTLSLQKEPRYERYVIKRVFRLYPPYAVAILAGLAVSAAVPGPLIWQHFLMVGWEPFDTTRINAVIWTIIVEMKVSLLLPFLFLFTARWGWIAGTVPSFLLVALAIRFTPLDFLRFAPLFAFGMGLAIQRARVVGFVARLRLPALLAGLLACGALYWVRDVVPGYGTAWKHFVSGAGSVGLIAIALSRPAVWRFLSFPPFAFVGRISFSLYLLHLPVLAVTANRAQTFVGLPAAIVLVLVAGVLVASIAYVLVERPAQRAGHWFAARYVRSAQA